MLPLAVILALPAPAAILLLLLTTHHLLPLLSLRPSLPLLPSVLRLTGALSLPLPRRNLPREFFNLPPRTSASTSASASSRSVALGVRSKVLLLLLGHAALSLGGGWAFLLRPDSGGRWGWAALSTTSLPGTMALLATFTAIRDPASPWPNIVMAGGGLRHETVFPRILPASAVLPLLLSALCPALPRAAPTVLLVAASFFTGTTVAAGAWCAARRARGGRSGRIRLYDPLPSRSASAATIGQGTEVLTGEKGGDSEAEQEFRRLREQSSWISSPSTMSGRAVPDFSYSTAELSLPATQHRDVVPAPYVNHVHPSSHTSNGTPTSWVSSPTTSPATLPTWEYSPSVGSLVPTGTQATPRQSTSASRSRTASTPAHRQAKSSAQTASSFDPLGTPRLDHSILASYSPDPFQPQPRGFESLSTFHPSQSDLDVRGRGSLKPNASPVPPVPPLPPVLSGNGTGWEFVPAQKISPGSNTLRCPIEPQTPLQQSAAPVSIRGGGQSTSPHHLSAVPGFKTPRRAPPPLPLPLDAARPGSLPLSPLTPGFLGTGKESMEGLLGPGPEERDWVRVDGGVDALSGWGRGSDGSVVGVIGVAWSCVSYGLTLPLLLLGPSTATQLLFLLALLLPAPLLALSTHLLSYRPAPPYRPTRARSSHSSSAYRSLALQSETQLALPPTVSPRLTPPAPSRSGSLSPALGGAGGPRLQKGGRLSQLLQSKPSISNFGYPRPRARPLSTGHRRHTVLGLQALSLGPLGADGPARPGSFLGDDEAQVRRALAKRSGDVWLAMGHAKENLNLLQRAGEMMRPLPALRVLEGTRTPRETREGEEGLFTRLRGGVVSMLMPSSFSLGATNNLKTADVEMRRLSRQALEAEAREWEENLPDSPIQVELTSPSRYQRWGTASRAEPDVSDRADRRSILSRLRTSWRPDSFAGTAEGEPRFYDAEEGEFISGAEDEEDDTELGHEAVGEGEIQTAQRGRKSISPTTVVFPSWSLGQSVDPSAPQRGPGRMSFSPAAEDHSTPRARPSSHFEGRFLDKSRASRSDGHSWDELQFADADETRSAAHIPNPAGRGQGIDLPPFPIVWMPSGGHGEAGNESSLMRVAMSDIAPALSHFDGAHSTPRRLLHQASTESRLRLEAVREVAPYLAHGTPRSFPAQGGAGDSPYSYAYSSTTGDLLSVRHSLGTRDRLDSIRTVNTIHTVDEEGADEMERVLAMDTPTRAAFVISPISAVSDDAPEQEGDDQPVRSSVAGQAGQDQLRPRPRPSSVGSRPLSRVSSRSASSRADYAATALELQSIGQRLSAASLHSLYARPSSGYGGGGFSGASVRTDILSEAATAEADESIYLTSPYAPPVPALPSYAVQTSQAQTPHHVQQQQQQQAARSHPHPPPLALPYLPAVPDRAATPEPTVTTELQERIPEITKTPARKHKYTISLDYIHTPSRPLTSATATAGQSFGPPSAFVHVSPSKSKTKALATQAASKVARGNQTKPQLKVQLPTAYPPIPVPLPVALPTLPSPAATAHTADRPPYRPAAGTSTPHSAHTVGSATSVTSGTTTASGWTDESPATKVAERWAEFRLGRRELEKVQTLRARSQASKEGLGRAGGGAVARGTDEVAGHGGAKGELKEVQRSAGAGLRPLLLQGTSDDRQPTAVGTIGTSDIATRQNPALKPLRLAQGNERRRSSLLLTDHRVSVDKPGQETIGHIGVPKGSKGSVGSFAARVGQENAPGGKKGSRGSAVGPHSPRKRGSAGAGSAASPKKVSRGPLAAGSVIRM